MIGHRDAEGAVDDGDRAALPPVDGNGRRRTQAERRAETQQALIEAAIALLHRHGYAGTATEAIADAAGVSRGALRHHFPTRAHLMSGVIEAVYEREHRAYLRLRGDGLDVARPADWPDLLWRVLNRPGGLAVIEILQASRNDPDLTARVAPAQARIEEIATDYIGRLFPGHDPADARAAMRLFVWAIRGLAIAQLLTPDPDDAARAVSLFRRMVEAAVTTGVFPAAGDPDTSPLR